MVKIAVGEGTYAQELSIHKDLLAARSLVFRGALSWRERQDYLDRFWEEQRPQWKEYHRRQSEQWRRSRERLPVEEPEVDLIKPHLPERSTEQKLLSRRQYNRWCKGPEEWDYKHWDVKKQCYIFPTANPDTFALYQQLIYTGKIPRDPTLVAPKITEQGFEDGDNLDKKPYVRCDDRYLCG